MVHGPAPKAFHAFEALPDITMKAQHVTLADLMPGFVEVEKGGVMRIAELRLQGCLYIRP